MQNNDDKELSQEIQNSFNDTTEPVEVNESSHESIVDDGVPRSPAGATLPDAIFTHPQKSSKKRIIIIIITLLLVAGAVGGYIAYNYFTSQTDAPAASTPATSTEPKKVELTPKDIIAKVKSVVAGETKEQNGTVIHNIPSTGVWVASSDKVKAPGLSIGATDVSDYMKDLQKVKKVLKENGINVVIENDIPDDSPNYRGHYASGEIACSLETQADGSLNGKDYVYSSYVTSVGCATIEDLVADAKDYEPFAMAYQKDGTNGSSRVFLGEFSEISNSKVSGYKVTSTSISDPVGHTGAAALFYQTPDGKWHYFLSTQNALTCDRYNTKDLKNAYAGETCYEGDLMSIVKAAT